MDLYLSNNNLTGELPDFLSNLPEIWRIRLYGNNLTGCLPKPPERPLPRGRSEQLSVGPDGEPIIAMGVPSLTGVEYCPQRAD